ncbi:MAG: M12 family metallo-peptidase [Phycisphaerales bacterium]|nr:M12 family metallo-peptidase [Phycisphaerales bacterium]
MNLQQASTACMLKGIELDATRLVDLSLVPFTAMADDGVIVVEGSKGRRFLQPEDIVHTYRGSVVGEPDSKVFVSVTDSKLNGFISRDDGIYWMATTRSQSEAELELLVTHSRDIPAWNIEGVEFCGIVANNIEKLAPQGAASDRSSGTCVVLEIALESDFEYSNVTFGGDTVASASYMVTLGAAVSSIYYSEIGVKYIINFVRVWEENDDPYDPTNGIDMLDQFRDHWVSDMGFVDRDVAHILSGRDNLPYGGVAFGGTTCSNNWGYSVSGYLSGSFPVPLEDNNGGNWDLVVMSHELGHNIGAPHTHDIGIDNCAGGDCDDAFGATMMSYCHTCSGGIGNMVLQFHPAIEEYMYSYLDSVSCDETGAATTAVDDNIFTSVNQPVDCDVLLNDMGASCDPASIALGTFDTETDNGGTIVLVPSSPQYPRDRLRYSPPLGFSTVDTFEYELESGHGATVIIDVGSTDDVLIVPTDYPTIQLAIDAAGSGDEIIVAPGIYRDVGEAVANVSGKSIWLHSSDGPDVTFIDGELQRACLELLGEEDQSTVVQGFTIVRGYAPAGGGVRVNGTPVILDCVIRDNYGQNFTAGMMCTGPFGPILSNVEFCHNTVGFNSCANTYGTWVDDDGTCTLSGWCSCPGDVNRDSAVTVDDLLGVLQLWGQECEGCPEDLYLDFQINVDDLLEVLSWWNEDCPSFDCP